ncbi:MAG: TlpA family protein disulfide reductase [Oligoflexales bacterium]
MKSRYRHVITTSSFLAVAFVIIGFLAKGLSLNPNAIVSPLVGRQAMDFDVPLIQQSYFSDKDHVSLEDLKGRPLILNFWASWCMSCREESHILEEFWSQHRDEMHILGIAVHDDAETARHFAQRFGKTYPLGLDVSGDASLNYGVTGVPETLFIDSQGVVRHKESGPISSSMLQSYWKKIKEI